MTEKRLYTTGRPAWYDTRGVVQAPLIIGVAGSTASGKTSVCAEIVRRLNVQWVCIVPTDSFYLPLTPAQRADVANYNFDHPNAFDWPLLQSTLNDLKNGKQVHIPHYNFVTHSRMETTTTIYGADIVIVEGIMALYDPVVRSMLDVKIFVDTDTDICLCRRIRRDIAERGRDVQGVLLQYERFVKPAFDEFVKPSARYADLIVPRGVDNVVAVDIVCTLLKQRLAQRAANARELSRTPTPLLVAGTTPRPSSPLPSGVIVLPESNVTRSLITRLLDSSMNRSDFISFSDRLIHLTLESALAGMPHTARTVITPTETEFKGQAMSDMCAVSIMRAGDAIVNNLKKIMQSGCHYGQLLIQSNELKQPSLFHVKLPKEVCTLPTLICDPTIATGQSLMMAIRVLLDCGAHEENIIAVTLFASKYSLMTLKEIFPRVTICAALICDLNADGYLEPSCGNFGKYLNRSKFGIRDLTFGFCGETPTTTTTTTTTGNRYFGTSQTDGEQSSDNNDDLATSAQNVLDQYS